jgi:hypothetical protein
MDRNKYLILQSDRYINQKNQKNEFLESFIGHLIPPIGRPWQGMWIVGDRFSFDPLRMGPRGHCGPGHSK